MLSRYAVLADRDFSSQEHLFQNISHSKPRGNSFRAGSQLSYTRAREVILEEFKPIGVPAGSIGLHSLRIGGASAAVNNGVLENIIKFHGRWKSDSSKDFNCRSILILIPIFVICWWRQHHRPVIVIVHHLPRSLFFWPRYASTPTPVVFYGKYTI